MAAENLLLQERSRLARELHDSLGHTVNVMVMQAGVGRRVFADNPDYSREALECIETLGRGALNELDQVLRVLQPDERPPRAAPSLLPSPTWRSSPLGFVARAAGWTCGWTWATTSS
jgi:hypothetical protein